VVYDGASEVRLVDEKSQEEGTILVKVLSEIRRAKSEKRLSMKAPIKKLTIHSVEEVSNVLRLHLGGR
jgi:valyl-tRNA synthetase